MSERACFRKLSQAPRPAFGSQFGLLLVAVNRRNRSSNRLRMPVSDRTKKMGEGRWLAFM